MSEIPAYHGPLKVVGYGQGLADSQSHIPYFLEREQQICDFMRTFAIVFTLRVRVSLRQPYS